MLLTGSLSGLDCETGLPTKSWKIFCSALPNAANIIITESALYQTKEVQGQGQGQGQGHGQGHKLRAECSLTKRGNHAVSKIDRTPLV